MSSQQAISGRHPRVVHRFARALRGGVVAVALTALVGTGFTYQRAEASESSVGTTAAAVSPGVSPPVDCSNPDAPFFNPCNFSSTSMMDVIAHPRADTVIVASHRGLHALTNGQYRDVPENSKAAISNAARAGLAQIELDVKLNRDGTPVLSHDQTVGRETNYRVDGAFRQCGARECFDPFTPPGNTLNDRRNPAITSLTDAQLGIGNPVSNTVLRDSISLRVPSGATERMLTLADALDHMSRNGMQMVVALDIRTPAIARASLDVVAARTDSRGRPWLDSVMFKVPFVAAAEPGKVQAMFPHHRDQVNYQPVFNTGDACGFKVDGVCQGYYGAGPVSNEREGEAAMVTDFREVEERSGVNIPAVEVQIKKVGGNLSYLMEEVRRYGDSAQRRSITFFAPYADIIPAEHNLDPTRAPYFFTTNGYCCQTLPDFFFKGSPGFPSDDRDSRFTPGSFITQQKFNGVTYDNAVDLAERVDTSRGATNVLIPRDESDPYKVMVVGDSISQGHEGDFTWRYRMAQWFDQQDVPVDFVGPYRGTYTAEAPHAPRPPKILGAPDRSDTLRVGGGYRRVGGTQIGFDSNHFAVWGRQVNQDKGLIEGFMNGLEQQGQEPDILLVELGFNDMGWGVSDAAGTLRSMREFVDNARNANPDVAMVIANVPQRTDVNRPDLVENTRRYNAALRSAILGWSTVQSPIELADFDGEYGCDPTSKTCDSAYDGLHPTELGEYRIARAFQEAISASLLPTTDPAPVPSASSVPSRPLGVPNGLAYDGAGQGVTVTWNPIYGAYGYDVQWRDVTAGTTWEDAYTTFARWDKSWQFLSPVIKGHTYEVRVRASAGDSSSRKSGWSGTVRGVADQHVAPPPTNIKTSPTATGLDVTWDEPTGEFTDSIGTYALWVWDRTAEGSFPGADGLTVGRTSAHIDGLTPGHSYMVFMASWNAAGEGVPEVARPVVPGAGAPARPSGLRIESIDPVSARVTWSPSAGAAGYRVWTRNVNDPTSKSKPGGVEMGTNATVTYLYPGVWNYEFCVSAVNGGLESEKSTCQVAPRPAGS